MSVWVELYWRGAPSLQTLPSLRDPSKQQLLPHPQMLKITGYLNDLLQKGHVIFSFLLPAFFSRDQENIREHFTH